MIRALLALAALIVCTGLADAASRHRPHKHRQTQLVAPAYPQGQIYPSRPAWAPANACFTDEGYGRFLPCNAGGGRGR
jgi:hypothetical protein